MKTKLYAKDILFQIRHCYENINVASFQGNGQAVRKLYEKIRELEKELISTYPETEKSENAQFIQSIVRDKNLSWEKKFKKIHELFYDESVLAIVEAKDAKQAVIEKYGMDGYYKNICNKVLKAFTNGA